MAPQTHLAEYTHGPSNPPGLHPWPLKPFWLTPTATQTHLAFTPGPSNPSGLHHGPSNPISLTVTPGHSNQSGLHPRPLKPIWLAPLATQTHLAYTPGPPNPPGLHPWPLKPIWLTPLAPQTLSADQCPQDSPGVIILKLHCTDSVSEVLVWVTTQCI